MPLTTYLFEIATGREESVKAATATLQERWSPRTPHPEGWEAEDGPLAGQPAPEQEDPLTTFVHFLSFVVLPPLEGLDDQRSWLVIEVSADDAEADLAQRLEDAIPGDLKTVLDALEPGSTGVPVAQRLARGRVSMGTRLFDRPGLPFRGTPGMTVRRIRAEARLSARVRELLRPPHVGMSKPGDTALARVGRVREQVFQDATLKWALSSEPVPLLAAPSARPSVVASLAIAAARDYLWMLLPLPLLAGLICTIDGSSDVRRAAYFAGWAVVIELVIGLFLVLTGNRLRRLSLALVPPILAAAAAVVGVDDLSYAALLASQVLAVEVAGVVLFAAWCYRQIRHQEDAEAPFDAEPDAEHMAALLLRENFRGVAQNHLAGQSLLKPGLARRAALRLALWTIAELIQLKSRAGFLGNIGTIHFARWYLMPDRRRLLFLSNYDGSWQSYLEDFIARLREGLSSVWSNTVDFPKTQLLTEGGAADGARFKRWARRQQAPTLAWFTAYPSLSAASIRRNAALRLGLASVATEAEAASWLAALGQTTPEALAEQEVPTLVFGGLSSLAHAHAVILRFKNDASSNCWLRDLPLRPTYGTVKSGAAREALVVGFTSAGLGHLGVPNRALGAFPVAFQQGMGHEARAKLLGDFVPADLVGPQRPRWGIDGTAVDAVCLVYADTEQRLDERLGELRRHTQKTGQDIVFEQRMAPLPSGSRRGREPFGFRDGLSQPVIRGTSGWHRPENAIHVIRPGEIVLGYPDNLGQRAPTPVADGIDWGSNGSFLVLRQFEQDNKAFEEFLTEQADRLRDHAALANLSRRRRREWVAAKMVGRYRNGAPLTRGGAAGSASARNNDFLYGKEDLEGLRCPFGAHIRRANPRDSLDPGSNVQLAISNRHRILRVGRPIQAADGRLPGMFFMCLNADIERQFEFLQQTWVLGRGFHGLDDEVDSLLGPGGRLQAQTVQGSNGPLRLEPLRIFVRTMGGGYFFLPGLRCLERLGTLRASPPQAVAR